MPWKCPNGCHKADHFCVKRAEYREDCIINFFARDDKNLSSVQSYKVYTGEDSKYDPPQCDNCDAVVEWED